MASVIECWAGGLVNLVVGRRKSVTLASYVSVHVCVRVCLWDSMKLFTIQSTHADKT